jgi:hypothetical protein
MYYVLGGVCLAGNAATRALAEVSEGSGGAGDGHFCESNAIGG